MPAHRITSPLSSCDVRHVANRRTWLPWVAALGLCSLLVACDSKTSFQGSNKAEEPARDSTPGPNGLDNSANEAGQEGIEGSEDALGEGPVLPGGNQEVDDFASNEGTLGPNDADQDGNIGGEQDSPANAGNPDGLIDPQNPTQQNTLPANLPEDAEIIQIPGDDPIIITDAIPGEPGNPAEVQADGSLKLTAIGDQKVNSGQASPNFSERLVIPIRWQGAQGGVDLEMESSIQTVGLSIQGPAVVWRPGYRNPDGRYENQIGARQVTLMATDAGGQKSSISFEVEAVGLERSIQKVEVTDPTLKNRLMRSAVTITERLHPERRYNHVNSMGGQTLNVQTCISFDENEPSITLSSPPLIESQGYENNLHSFRHQLDYPAAQQYAKYDSASFVTWLNFAPSPVSSVSSNDEAPNIRTIYTFSRCNDENLQADDCSKKAFIDHGLKNQYYCSEYFSEPADKYRQDLLSIYCNNVRSYGLTAPECG